MNKSTRTAMFSSKTGEWSTPQDFFDELDAVHHFTLDPCATIKSAKCKKFYTLDDDGAYSLGYYLFEHGHVIAMAPALGITVESQHLWDIGSYCRIRVKCLKCVYHMSPLH